MKTLFCVCVSVLMVASVRAERVIPGTLHVIVDCDKEIKAEPNDMAEIQIPNPALAVRVHDLHVDAKADAVLAGVVNTTNGLPGGDRISIFIGFKTAARSGTVDYSYKDGENKEHKCKLTIQVIRR